METRISEIKKKRVNDNKEALLAQKEELDRDYQHALRHGLKAHAKALSYQISRLLDQIFKMEEEEA